MWIPNADRGESLSPRADLGGVEPVDLHVPPPGLPVEPRPVERVLDGLDAPARGASRDPCAAKAATPPAKMTKATTSIVKRLTA